MADGENHELFKGMNCLRATAGKEGCASEATIFMRVDPPKVRRGRRDSWGPLGAGFQGGGGGDSASALFCKLSQGASKSMTTERSLRKGTELAKRRSRSTQQTRATFHTQKRRRVQPLSRATPAFFGVCLGIVLGIVNMKHEQ